MNCFNRVTIFGKTSLISNLESKFKSAKNGTFNYKNYSSLFSSDMTDVVDDDWGPKWFKPIVENEGNYLKITGDSEWIPPISLFEFISEEYGVRCHLIYDNSTMDYAGEIIWEGGDLIENESYTSWEYRFLKENESFYMEAEYAVACHESVDEWLAGLNLEKWKQKPNIDINRLQKILENL